ncbi:MAG: hypothetical protein K1X50_10410 [Candidatus Promineofilum sp.]|nr:hypothetical protein [Promineifilum sp.]MCW5864143.1 hypothetical protein [Anaerolineae bacterium]
MLHRETTLAKLLCVSIPILALLAACGAKEAGSSVARVATPEPTAASGPLASATPRQGTATTVPLPTLTPDPVQITVGQPTPSDNNTSIVMVTPMWASQQILDQVRHLLIENAGCALPCWWGIEPGKTTWEEAKVILSPVALQIGDPRRLSSQIAYDVLIPVPPDVFPTQLEQRYVVQDGVVQRMEVMPGELEVYQLSELLAGLGQPEEVWIKTYARKREGSLPFSIVLYYPDRGVLVDLGTEADVESKYIIACPQAASASYLVLWSPEKLLTLQEVVDGTLRLETFERWQYQKLDATTNLDAASFFETFLPPDNASCIRSEATHWPMP